ncbi:FhaA domain-containing protein [Dactylosporangium sp. AC04546]|uniref:FhaA domain-containing protein n=1 Tax=Dactylosporangium sp. AC04546 TaxID=2862460 RepID=UPI001EDF3BC5|nr:FhaA domain-containing protein [Dactylosporangium sp. AC04546]WVK84313.1 FhaA domain-containing protein [Dactylosporangium sp. AC04546]
MVNALVVPLLLLAVVAVLAAALGPSTFTKVRAAVGGKLPTTPAGSRLRRLSRLIRDGVVRGADKSLATTILPPRVQVTLAPADAELLQRHRELVEDELNEQWRATAEREGWHYPGRITVEISAADDRPAGRPHLHLRYDGGSQGDPTTKEADDRTPFAHGWFVLADRRVVAVPRQGLTIGRGDRCGLVVPDKNASRQHVRLSVRGDGTLLVEDLNSTNGTFVDDAKVGRHTVDHDAELRLGKDHKLKLVRR